MTDRYDLEILPICLGLHMAHTGSSDPLPEEDKASHVAWLRQRLAEWQPTAHAQWGRFDEAVKALIMATLDEVDPMPLDVLTPEEQDLVIAAIPLQTGLTRDGQRVIAAADVAREEAEAQLRALGQSPDMAAALVRNASAVLPQGHTIGLTAESAPKLHAILSAYAGVK